MNVFPIFNNISKFYYYLILFFSPIYKKINLNSQIDITLLILIIYRYYTNAYCQQNRQYQRM